MVSPTTKRLGWPPAGDLAEGRVADLYSDHHLGGLTRVASLLGANVEVIGVDGPWLLRTDGSRLLDCNASNGAIAFGHDHPSIRAAAHQAVDESSLGFPGLLPSPGVATLCHDLVAIAPPGLQRAVLYNTGAEAIEGALVLSALARPGRPVYVGFEGGFHGKSAAARAVGGIPNERQGFPLWAQVKTLPYGDLDAATSFLEREGKRVAAVVVEPIQSNAGVRIAPDGFLPGLREVCRQTGALLVIDEVSTGFGRTGAMFACERESVTPDLLCVAKALSGGLVPIGAVLVDEGLAKVMANPTVASHFSTTFAGGRLATRVALEVIRLLVEESLPERAARLGQQLEQGLLELKQRHPRLLVDVRGRGLLWGLELADPATLTGKLLPRGLADFVTTKVGGSVALAFQRYLAQHQGVLVAPTAADRRVVRVFPPLTAEPEAIDALLAGLDGALRAGLPAWVKNLA